MIQSSYIPWRGYFDFIDSVDIFVFHDDLQYTKGDWRNRNCIKTAKGTEWLTVPVHYKTVSQLICDTQVDQSRNWGQKHLRQLQANYRETQYLGDILDIVSVIDSPQEKTISELNIELTKRICEYLSINTPMFLSSELSVTGRKTERLIEILQKLKATTYLSGPSAEDYLDKEAFRKNGISLEYKTYDYEAYPQLWGEFEGRVSILDLIANRGTESKEMIHSKSMNMKVVL